MESVAAHARVVELAGQRVHLFEQWLSPVHRGVEAGDLGQGRIAREQRPDRSEVVRLVQRRKRDQLLELRDDRGIDANRLLEAAAAVGDTMPDRRESVVAAVPRPQPVDEVPERALVPEPVARLPRFSPTVWPAASRATKAGAVKMPPTCPPTTSAGSAPCAVNTENFRLDEPAFRTRIASVISRHGPGHAVAPGLRDQHGLILAHLANLRPAYQRATPGAA